MPLVSDEKQAVTLTENPLYVKILVSSCWVEDTVIVFQCSVLFLLVFIPLEFTELVLVHFCHSRSGEFPPLFRVSLCLSLVSSSALSVLAVRQCLTDWWFLALSGSFSVASPVLFLYTSLVSASVVPSSWLQILPAQIWWDSLHFSFCLYFSTLKCRSGLYSLFNNFCPFVIFSCNEFALLDLFSLHVVSFGSLNIF